MAQPKYRIATIGSHSALQIFKGAHDEGFKTIAVCKKGSERPYKMFNSADEIITLNSYRDFPKIQNELIKKNAIIIPHGSFVTYMGYEEVEKLKVNYYGNKKILKWESDRYLERQWLTKSGLKVPLLFKKPEDIDRLVIVKFMGAEGGRGYFLAKDKKDFYRKIKPYQLRKYVLQEYIIGVPLFIHYFYSSLTNEIEIMGCDIRYESNVDSLGRISARDQIVLPKIDPSYVIVGNIPVVVRESFLPRLIEMGEDVVKTLETILTPEEEIFVFEISARIVAGTNPFIEGSPYTWLKYNKPMSTGRRIAIEIKNAMNKNQMKKILG
ncbi:formate--phosphoribosylaminoimidazolecarboxamide ligase [Candidatus Woesearchaeota archaeon]|nr:formate--phosphoribosylaminoimidazolecarboxamide ligase [Candidatus Woesearchaeota archaeon]